jgi:beta-galactosidase GanA
VYVFDGNRDVDYLLTLCEQLGLFVLAAPGPYICAETQGGGYPAWLAAKRDLRIRHNSIMLWRTYDAEFARYEIQWLDHILPILARHQITENNDQRRRRGCVLALQIDNELFENMATILPVGLRDQMRILSKAARDANITVPLFTNDGFEEGGWVPGKKANFWSKYPFGIDLYGFDKYVGKNGYLMRPCIGSLF